MTPQVIAYLAIFGLITIVGFKVLNNLKVILMLVIAGFFAFYLTNHVTKDRDPAEQVKEYYENTTGTIVTFNKLVNELTEMSIKDNQPLEDEILRNQHNRAMAENERIEEHQKKMVDEQMKQWEDDKEFVQKIKNAKIW